MRRLMLLAPMLLAACDALPKDPEGTLDRIRSTGQLRVGLVADGREGAKAPALIAALSRATGARATVHAGPTDPLLASLDAGDLDIVIGPFARDSPLKTEVAFAPPLETSGTRDAPIETKAAIRNGENRWIMQVERASREVSGR